MINYLTGVQFMNLKVMNDLKSHLHAIEVWGLVAVTSTVSQLVIEFRDEVQSNLMGLRVWLIDKMEAEFGVIDERT